jgi:hypothetical protein
MHTEDRPREKRSKRGVGLLLLCIPKIDHARLARMIAAWTNHSRTWARARIRDTAAAVTSGKAQYPSAHRLWKNDLRGGHVYIYIYSK